MSVIKKVEYRVVENLDEQGRLLGRTWQDPVSHYPHRVDGPAVQTFDPETGQPIGEIWLNQRKGGKHRENNLPAEVAIEPATGVVVVELYFQHNQSHRDDGKPAQIYRDSETGHITMSVYCFEGWKEREDDLPAVREFSGENGLLLRDEYYHANQLHRIGRPAVIEYDGSGAPIQASLRYYTLGERVQAPEDTDKPGMN